MIISYSRQSARASLLALMHPRGQSAYFAVMLAAGMSAGWFSVARLGMPLWFAVALGLVLLAFPAMRKWRYDRSYLGTPMMVLSVLLATQTFHTIEHVAQWVQYHLLGWPLARASGLLSPLNAEVVHFSWNLMVLLTVVYLLAAGMRNRWMWLLLIWATAHTAEHTYMFINYLQEVQRLASAGLPLSGAQGLPGFFGNSGWLDLNKSASGVSGFVCTFAPALTNASRLDVHFWWNVGEMTLLLLAAHTSVRQFLRSSDAR